MPRVFLAIAVLLIGNGLLLDRVLDWIGAFPYGVRLLCCFALVAPPAFLMGFPMPTAMTWLGRLGKHHMFIWAWGINGCFSVIGAALVPLVATSLGLAAVLQIGGAAYLLALPAFYAVLLPFRAKVQSGSGAGARGAEPRLATAAVGSGDAARDPVPSGAARMGVGAHRQLPG
jgi:hypothetical protein